MVRERVLELFGAERQRAIRAAFRAGEPWPPEWLADVNAAYGVLAASPRTDEDALLEHYDFLRWIGASERAGEVLELALARFPDAPRLHERLRGRLLWQGGPEELERVYAERLARRADPATDASQLAWFAGYAELVAAEHYRRRSRFEPALDAYERGLARFAEHAARFPESRDDDLHYQALAHAGRARVRMERGELADATRELLRALELRADSAASPDGLGITPLATATMLQAKLNEAGDAERAAAQHGALDALDPRLLEPLPSERFGRGRRGPRGGR
ncbi:MAG: hypothetical protein H6828_07805 [Planctomycetes bacterium]|nr:hypothetical protein [Planctomycetota bacterium]